MRATLKHPMPGRSNNFKENVYQGFDAVVEIFLTIVNRAPGANPRGLLDAFDIRSIYNAAPNSDEFQDAIAELNTILNRNIKDGNTSATLKYDPSSNTITITCSSPETTETYIKHYYVKDGIIQVV